MNYVAHFVIGLPQRLAKLFQRHSGLSEDSPQRPRRQLAVKRHYASNIAFPEHYTTAALAHALEAESFQSAYGLAP